MLQAFATTCSAYNDEQGDNPHAICAVLRVPLTLVPPQGMAHGKPASVVMRLCTWHICFGFELLCQVLKRFQLADVVQIGVAIQFG